MDTKKDKEIKEIKKRSVHQEDKDEAILDQFKETNHLKVWNDFLNKITKEKY